MCGSENTCGETSSPVLPQIAIIWELNTLANTASARKRIRTNARKNMKNVMYRSQVRTMVKKAKQTINSKEPDQQILKEAIATLDKAVSKGIIHRNNAARHKSRLMKRFNASSQGA